MDPILIVDDEEAIAQLIAITLENAGYTCVTAGDGAAAANAFEQDEFFDGREHDHSPCYIVCFRPIIPHFSRKSNRLRGGKREGGKIRKANETDCEN